MIRIYIFADSHKHFQTAIGEYVKRLGKQVELIELKPIKKGNSQQIIQSETQILCEKLKNQSSYTILLHSQGELFSSHDLAACIQTHKNRGQKISFVIGGALGLEYDVCRKYCDKEFSLGAITLPHSLALLILLEQIYRSFEIEKNTGYHK